jgi:hypothetical protein
VEERGGLDDHPRIPWHSLLLELQNLGMVYMLTRPKYQRLCRLFKIKMQRRSSHYTCLLIEKLTDKALGLVRYVDKSMANVGYQKSDIFIRPDPKLIRISDANLEGDLDLGPGYKSDGDCIVANGSGGVGRVEYDMDKQDDKWLQEYNAERKSANFEPITCEIFEITITKIEKDWHNLEKRIPKLSPKSPQTYRPSSAASVSEEPQAGEEEDSKCAICDNGDSKETNLIVFCDSCDLAVHQDCYGDPFIPERQWLCRKCQLIGRGVPVDSLPFYYALSLYVIRLVSSVRTPIEPSNKPTHRNGPIYYVPCGSLKLLLEITPLWSLL